MKDEGREMHAEHAEDCSQVWQVVKISWQMVYVSYTSKHLQLITSETKQS